MSDKKSIEKLFGDALGKAGAQPPEGTEDAIRKKLTEAGLLKEKPSKKRFFFWLWCVSGLVILSVISGYFLNDDDKNATQTTLQPEQKPSALTVTGQENNIHLQYDSLPSAAETQIAAEENGMASNANTKSNTADRENFKEDAKNITGNSKGNKPANAGQKVRPGEVKGKDGSLAANNAKAEPEENSSSGEQGNRNIGQDSAAQKNQDTGYTQNSDKKEVGEPGDSSVITANNVASQNTDSVNAEEKKKDLPPDSLAKGKTKRRYSIDLFVAPQISNFKYESGNASYQAVTNTLDISETEKISFNAGIGVNIPLNNFFVEPGINFSLLKSDFSYSKMQTSIDTSGSHYNFEFAMIYVLDTNGVVIDSFIVHSDSSWVTVGDTSYLKIPVNISNKISILEIPFWAGYKFSAGKFDIEVKAGASVSFITSINTTILPANSEAVVLYDDRKNSPYRKNYFSLLAAANVVYNINDKFSVFLQPAFKYGLGSIFNNDYPVSKKIQSYSLGAGLRINF